MNTKAFRSILGLVAVVLAMAATVLAAPDQPRMQQARESLLAAKASLQRADANKGGHRVRAIEYINSAIVEVNRGIAFDRRHNHAQPSASVNPDQPNMRAALDQLNNAKANLEAASNDKGGHRVKAIEYVDKAISEVKDGIAAAS